MIEPEELQFDVVAGTRVLRLSGDIDLSNAALVKRSILDSVSNRELKLALDLAEVGYLDSAGIGMLFELWSRLAQHQQRLILVVPAGSPLRRSLHVSGWPADVTMVETVGEATRAKPLKDPS